MIFIYLKTDVKGKSFFYYDLTKHNTKGLKILLRRKDGKLESVDVNLPFFNYGNMWQQKIDVHYIIYAEKTLVDPTDSTYPKSTQNVVDTGRDEQNQTS